MGKETDMRYRDEEILRKREELRRRNYASLEKGYYMDWGDPDF